MVASEVSGVPWSFTAHRWDIIEGNLIARKSAHATFARFISQSGLQMALSQGVSRQKSFVLHLGVRLPSTNLADQPRCFSEPRPFRILCPAALIPRKGHVYLIEALSLLDRDVELWLAGDGELRQALEAQVVKLGLQNRVRFLGQCPHDALLKLYEDRQVDAVVLPSLHEGIPVALIEAMSYGLPVISTRTGGVPELLDGGAGLLVPPKDSLALAEAIRRLMDNKDLARELGRTGCARVQEQFALDKVVNQLAARFEKGAR
ncbi:MAG: glycosyltransferase [Limnochordales bacterium]|nr:glycosyltransferase [Limnochordales bacterium]